MKNERNECRVKNKMKVLRVGKFLMIFFGADFTQIWHWSERVLNKFRRVLNGTKRKSGKNLKGVLKSISEC